MSGPVDAELLAALLPEFAAGATKLGRAPDAAAARRALDGLGAMAAGAGLGSLGALLDGAAPLLDPFDAAGLAALGERLGAQLAAIAAAGADVALPAEAPAAIRTLIVDDSAVMRRLLREILAADPAFETVAEAADGAAGLEAMRRLAPALILLDLEMPVLDGMGFLRRWALEGTGAVILVSSAVPPGGEVAVAARRLGVAGILGKPSGAVSLDMATRGAALLRLARRAAGLPPAEAGA
jgi:CheY-like chemotaxis protein